MPRRRKDGEMTWQSLLRLPDKAGAMVDSYAERRGLDRATTLRVIVMEWVESQELGLHRRQAYNWGPPTKTQEQEEEGGRAAEDEGETPTADA